MVRRAARRAQHGGLVMKLALEGVGKTVEGEMHLADISCPFNSGINVLLGPTGAGKTSLLRLLAGLDRPSSGRILLDGQDITALGVKKRSVAMVYQQFVNYPSLTIYENIASPLRQGATRVPAAEIDGRVREAARLLHIDNLLDRMPNQLSGGQQQRTAIARAIVKGADLLLLDEPLVNLDYKLREELRIELRSLFAKRDTVVVYATTEPSEALLLGGDCVVLDRGRALQSGPTLQVFHHPATTRVGELFSDPPMNLLEATIDHGHVRLAPELAFPLPAHMRDLAPGRYRLGVRPNHVTLQTAGAEGVAIDAQVDLAEISGSETYLHLRHHDLAFIAQVKGVHAFELGAPARVWLDRARLFAFDAESRLVGAPGNGIAAGTGG
ncbi:MAG TPA: ABC transporter ATP-binding protein [Dongiaceae bacterium]|nr:ABC transporter ATP-binding protein [Dongiaceae bacterium]